MNFAAILCWPLVMPDEFYWLRVAVKMAPWCCLAVAAEKGR
jgi:hypothetical protein